MTAIDKLDLAIQSGDYDDVKKRSEVLARGWLKMEEETLAAGHKPHGVDTVWYVAGKDGLEYIVCKHELDSARLVAAHPDKASSVYTLADIAKMIERESLPNNMTQDSDTFLKRMFEKKAVDNSPMESDEIPFWN